MDNQKRFDEFKDALKYILFIAALIAFLDWISDETSELILWFVIFQTFIGLCNLTYSGFRMIAPNLTHDWIDSPKNSLFRGTYLILFSLALWLVFYR